MTGTDAGSSAPRADAAFVFGDAGHFLAFGFGSGLAPVAPGTAGTLAAIPLYLALSSLSPVAYLAVVAAAFALGVWLCGRTADALGVHDHAGIVWDELVGYWITMALVEPGLWQIIAGFFLFRLFDVWKPWPIRVLDRKLGGGFGIMLDDVLAGLLAAVCLVLVFGLRSVGI